MAGIVILAFLVRAVPILRGAGLHGYIGYDDGVYFGSAVALVHGVAPYRDFLLLHPPGITLLLSPFALLGAATDDATGFAVARVAFMVLGAFNAGLVTLLTGRFGRRAALLAGVLYAVWYAGARVERSTLLIGPETTLLLIGVLVLASRRSPGARRAILGGAALGLAVALQIWEVLPVLIVVGAFAATWRTSPGGWQWPTLACLTGVLAVAAIVCLPFLLAAPESFIRYVLVDQVARPSNGISFIERLRGIEAMPPGVHLKSVLGAVAIGLAAVGVGALGLVAWRVPAARMWCLLVAAETAYLLTAPIFITHYSAWVAPAAAIVLGTAAGITLDALDRRPRFGAPARAGAIALLAGLAVVTIVVPQGMRMDRTALEKDTQGVACVAADAPALLIETGALQRDLRDGCQLVLDPTGTSYDTDRGRLAAGSVGASRQVAVGYQAAMVHYYSSAGAAMFIRKGSDGLTAASIAAIRGDLPMTDETGLVAVWVGRIAVARDPIRSRTWVDASPEIGRSGS